MADHDPIKVTKLNETIHRQTQRWRTQHTRHHSPSQAQAYNRNLHPSQQISTRPHAKERTATLNSRGEIVEPERVVDPTHVRHTDILVVGGGPSGLAAALAAKRSASSSPNVTIDVTLVESAGYFGGTVTKTGMETMGWYRYPGTRECHSGLGREMERRAESMGFASKWPFNESVCLHPHHFKYVADCLVKEAGVKPLLHSRVVEVIMKDGDESVEENDGANTWSDERLSHDHEDDEDIEHGSHHNTDNYRTIIGVILETPSGREAILAKRIIDTTGDAIVAYLSGAPFRKTHKSEMMGVTTVFGVEGVDKEKFEKHIQSNKATYKDWNTDSWEALNSGKEDTLASPYWASIFEEAVKEGIIPDRNKIIAEKKKNNNHSNDNTDPNKEDPLTEVDICGSWSAISPAGVATNLNLVHMKEIDPTQSDDVTRAEITGREHVYSAMAALRAKVPGFENASLNSVSAHLGVRDSRYLDSYGGNRLSGWHVTNEGTCEDSIGVFPEFVDGYNVLILPTTGRVFEVPLSMMIPKKVDNLILAGRHVDVDPVASAAMRNMMACTVTGQGAGVAAAVSLLNDKTIREVEVDKVQKELRRQGVSLSKADILEKENAERGGFPWLTSKL